MHNTFVRLRLKKLLGDILDLERRMGQNTGKIFAYFHSTLIDFFTSY